MTILDGTRLIGRLTGIIKIAPLRKRRAILFSRLAVLLNSSLNDSSECLGLAYGQIGQSLAVQVDVISL